VELQKVEEELFTSTVKLVDLKMQMMKEQRSEKPELLLASND